MLLRQIKYFVAIVDCNSFTEAAEQCFISQSAISQQIGALEAELGVKLTKRDGRMFTLLEKYDLKGKRIVPFCTNEGSGMGNSERDLIKLCKGATVAHGLSIQGVKAALSEKQVVEWAKSHI